MNIIRQIREKRIQKKLDEYNKSGILRYFHYDFGKMRGNRKSYTIIESGNELILTVQEIIYESGEEKREDFDIPPIIMQQLKALIRDNAIFLWKGYDKHNTLVEGDSFSLCAKFDNYDIMAEGASMLPNGFERANSAIEDFFDNLISGV